MRKKKVNKVCPQSKKRVKNMIKRKRKKKRIKMIARKTSIKKRKKSKKNHHQRMMKNLHLLLNKNPLHVLDQDPDLNLLNREKGKTIKVKMKILRKNEPLYSVLFHYLSIIYYKQIFISFIILIYFFRYNKCMHIMYNLIFFEKLLM